MAGSLVRPQKSDNHELQNLITTFIFLLVYQAVWAQACKGEVRAVTVGTWAQYLQ